MPWRPSLDSKFQRTLVNELWDTLQTLFADAVPFASHPRRGPEALREYYVRRRRGDAIDVAPILGRLPTELAALRLGATDIDLLDFILNVGPDRILRIEGPRGSGKTSLLHFAEDALGMLPLERRPRLLILNGNVLPEDTASVESFVGLLADELNKQAQSQGETAADAFAQAATMLSERRTTEQVVLALRRVLEGLPRGDAKLVVVVFDNLDQHSDNLQDSVVSLAKAVFLSTGIGSIVCMRLGAWGAAIKRPQFRNVFGYRVDVHSPSVDEWIATLGLRLAAAAHRRAHDIGVALQYDADQLKTVFRRLVELLLQTHREAEDVFSIFDTVAADDTRHLILLIKRLLAHRDLPTAWLLGEESTTGELPLRFHPLRCMLEGMHHVFKGEAAVPNLLCFQNKSTSQEFLLLQRILRLLDGAEHSVETEQLLCWLQELGYDPVVVREALPVLTNSLLVRSPDGERFGLGAPLPLELAISVAGRYYVNHLLEHPDYLTCAVLDVPLEHEAVRHEGADSFAARVSSLVEYTQRVRKLEDRQIQQLANRPPGPELRRVAESLSSGGLFTASLLRSLETIERQLSSGAAHRKHDTVVSRIENTIRSLRAWKESAEDRIEQRITRGTRRKEGPQQKRWSRSGVGVTLQSELIGDDFRVRVTSEGRGPGLEESVGIVAVQSVDKTTPLFQASLLRSTGKDLTVRNAHSASVLLPDVSGLGPLEPSQLRPQRLDIATSVNPSRLGLLIVDEIGDHFRIKLQAVTSPNGPISLSESISTRATEDWCREELERIAQLALTANPIRDRLRELGVKLYEQLLSTEGQNRLAHHLRLFDTVIVCSRLLSIPWELLCPPAVAHEAQPMIGDVWRIIRWPADPLNGLALYLLSSGSSSGSYLKTVGLEADARRAWREHVHFGEYSTFRRHCSGAETLHLVGHWNGEALEIKCCSLAVSAASITANGLPGPANVVVSSCGAATLPPGANIPVSITMGSDGKRVAWAPLIAISEADAQQVDEALEEFIGQNPNAPLEFFMRDYRSRLPILWLYVRYGISQA